MEQSYNTKRWFARAVFYLLLAGWFYILGCWLGPNLITFHKLEGMTAEDLVPTIQKYCVPAVREMKIYQRDHGHLPEGEGDMWSVFDPQNEHGPGISRLTRDSAYEYWGPGTILFKHTITYDFTPGHEGWSVRGPYVNGPIPLPPVTLEPGASAATQR